MGKSSSATAGYKYYAGFQMVFARYIHKLLRIRVDEKVAWIGVQDAEGVISINAPDLFGGAKSADPEGGVVGDVNFQPGLPTQMPDSYLAAKIGAAIPASRGVAALVGRQLYLGNNPYMKDWEVRGERIHTFDDGTTQWYDEKSAIPAEVTDDSSSLAGQFKLTAGAVSQNNGDLYYATSMDGDFDCDTIAKEALRLYNAWAVDNGHATYTFLSSFYSNNPATYGDAINAYAAETGYGVGIAGLPVTMICPTGYTATAEPTDEPAVVCNLTAAAEFDMNPAHMLRECLLNKEWGFGYDEDDLDDTSFRAVADTLFTEKFGLSYFWDDSTTEIGDVMENILTHIDAQLYVSRTTQLWTVMLIRDDYDQATLPEFSEGEEIISIDDFARPGFMDLINEVTVDYYNTGNASGGTITLPNSALFLQQGVKLNQENNYDMCCSASLASRICQRDLRTLGTPLASGSVYLKQTADTRALHRGSVVKLTFPKYSLLSTVVRCTSVTFGDGTSKRIKMTFAEDVFALPESVITALPPSGWVDPGAVPAAIDNRLTMEVPYAYLLKSQKQTDLDAELAADPGLGYVASAAARQGNALNALIYTDSGAGYTSKATLDYCAFGKLTADIGQLTDTFALSSTEDIDEAVVGSFFQIGNEIMSFTAIASGVLTGVTRGLFDTVASKHLADDGVFFIENYLDSDTVEYESGESVNVKLATVTTQGTLDLSAAPVDTVTLAGRAVAPYPPGKPQIGGVDYPSTVSGTFTMTWKHRNRVTQATQYVDTTMGDVTPEVNTRYTLRFLDASSAIIVSQDNIGPGTASVVLNYTGDVTAQLWSVTDNGRSLQQHSFVFAYTPPGGTVVSAITATPYTRVDNTPIIDGGSA